MIEHVPDSNDPHWWYNDFDFRPAGYYFWDENRTQCCGPYPTREECQVEFDKYAEYIQSLPSF